MTLFRILAIAIVLAAVGVAAAQHGKTGEAQGHGPIRNPLLVQHLEQDRIPGQSGLIALGRQHHPAEHLGEDRVQEPGEEPLAKRVDPRGNRPLRGVHGLDDRFHGRVVGDHDPGGDSG